MFKYFYSGQWKLLLALQLFFYASSSRVTLLSSVVISSSSGQLIILIKDLNCTQGKTINTTHRPCFQINYIDHSESVAPNYLKLHTYSFHVEWNWYLHAIRNGTIDRVSNNEFDYAWNLFDDELNESLSITPPDQV